MPSEARVESLLFDLGGVVIDIDFERAFEAWAPSSRLTRAEIEKRFSMDGPYERHERGEIAAPEYFAHLRDVLELDAADAVIADGWNAIFVAEITATVDRVRALRGRIPCLALTNSNPTHQDAWSSAHPRVVDAFDRVFVSSEMGLRKPERAAFEYIASATGCGLGTMLFFDDTAENVVGARAAGLQAVHVRSPADVERALAVAGIP